MRSDLIGNGWIRFNDQHGSVCLTVYRLRTGSCVPVQQRVLEVQQLLLGLHRNLLNLQRPMRPKRRPGILLLKKLSF